MTKFDKLGVLKQEISLAVLKARSLNSRCQQDNAPSKDSREKILPCLFQTVGDFRSSLAYDSIPPSLASTILWPFPLCVSVWSIFSSSHKETNHTGCRAHSNLVWPHPNLTNYICIVDRHFTVWATREVLITSAMTLFTNKVTFGSTGD